MKIVIMVPLVSFLAALRILTEAQICNNGEGKITYEKTISPLGSTNAVPLTNVSSGYEMIIRHNFPLKVLEECFQRCSEDRLNQIDVCVKFDFLPGKRRSESRSQNLPVKGIQSIDTLYEPSKCIFYKESNLSFDLSQSISDFGSVWHFNEVCLAAQNLNRLCPNRAYVFETISAYRLLDPEAKEVVATDKTDCENKCLTERLFACRSASFDSQANKCFLSQANRQLSPGQFTADARFEYMENMCLKHSEMCKWTVFITESGKQLESKYENFHTTASTLDKCSAQCLESLDRYGFLCRSFMFDQKNQNCVLYDEDPLNTVYEVSPQLIPSTGNLYRVLCSTEEKGKEVDNKTLECYRHKRLRGRHQVELSVVSFYECLTSCLQQYNQHCRSIEYSHRQHICRFSSHTVAGPLSDKDQDTLIDDDSFDYYQFMWNGLTKVPHSNMMDQLSDRQDSIDVSHSQSTAYGNFILPADQTHQTRVFHRAGFAYGTPKEYGTKTLSNEQQQYRKPVSYPEGHYTGEARIPTPVETNYNSHNTMARIPMASGSNVQQNRLTGYGVPPYVTNNNQPFASQMSFSGGSTVVGNTNGIGQAPPLPPNSVSNERYGPGATRPESSVVSTVCNPDTMPNDIAKFRRVGFSARLRSKHIYKVVRADKLEDCERYCLQTKDFICKSFNFRAFFPDNCELSSVDSKKYKLENDDHFEHNTQFDYYERVERKALIGTNSMDCFDVLQTCSPEGMEFKLKTPEGFYGRIYTYGFYDSCFFDGNGGGESSLRISRPNGFPRCGTQQIGDAMTNIVVVQFNDYVQTSRDKKYNLTCFISGPGEAVVTSNYLDTKTDGRHPMQIEHLPAQNILTSNILLRILYRGTPTNTIVVGDLLTFRLEARNQYRYNNYHNDIFASNVIAKDPYTGRQVLLIDSRGCPVDLFVFPELHKTPDGALEAEFYAFKIPDSNFLVFQATVKTCKGPCEPVICTDRGRGQGSFPSWGRRKRSVKVNKMKTNFNNNNKTQEEEVHELLRVYLSHEEVPEPRKLERPAPRSVNGGISGGSNNKICLNTSLYYSLVLFAAFFALILLVLLPYWTIIKVTRGKYQTKQSLLNQWPVGWFNQWYNSRQQYRPSTSGPIPAFIAPVRPVFSSSLDFTANQSNLEPIYYDPSVLERSRSLQSLTVLDTNKKADI